MKKIKEVLTDTVGKLANVKPLVKPEDKPVVVITNDGIEILGHKIEGVNSINDFVNYIKQIDGVIREKEKLESELRILRLEKIKLDKYLEAKIAESMFLRDHIDGTERLSIQEGIYRDIRDMIYDIHMEEWGKYVQGEHNPMKDDKGIEED